NFKLVRLQSYASSFADSASAHLKCSESRLEFLRREKPPLDSSSRRAVYSVILILYTGLRDARSHSEAKANFAAGSKGYARDGDAAHACGNCQDPEISLGQRGRGTPARARAQRSHRASAGRVARYSTQRFVARANRFAARRTRRGRSTDSRRRAYRGSISNRSRSVQETPALFASCPRHEHARCRHFGRRFGCGASDARSQSETNHRRASRQRSHRQTLSTRRAPRLVDARESGVRADSSRSPRAIIGHRGCSRRRRSRLHEMTTSDSLARSWNGTIGMRVSGEVKPPLPLVRSFQRAFMISTAPFPAA